MDMRDLGGGGDGNVLKLILVRVSQCYEFTKIIELYISNG